MCKLHIVICGHVPTLQYFSTLSHERHDFRKKTLLNTKCVFWFSLQILCETFLIIRGKERDMIKNVHLSSCKGRHSYPFLIKIKVSKQSLEKSSNIKFHENPSGGSGVVPCGRTERHDEANSRFSQFREHAWNVGLLNRKMYDVCNVGSIEIFILTWILKLIKRFIKKFIYRYMFNLFFFSNYGDRSHNHREDTITVFCVS